MKEKKSSQMNQRNSNDKKIEKKNNSKNNTANKKMELQSAKTDPLISEKEKPKKKQPSITNITTFENREEDKENLLEDTDEDTEILFEHADEEEIEDNEELERNETPKRRKFSVAEK